MVELLSPLKIRGAGCEYVLGGTLFSEMMFSKITLPCRGLNNSTIYVMLVLFDEIVKNAIV